jgi:hypothetical protein
MTSRKALLSNLLRTLVQEWGQREVEAALAQLSDTANSTNAPQLSRGEAKANHRTRSRMKLLASEQVARAQLPHAQEATLRELAVLFDRKQFLPSVSDVREFLIMMGETPGTMKDRSEAFRRVLKVLSELPPERLERLANSGLHSGPSQLGPLSDAISAAARSLPRYREPGAS